MRGQVRLYMRSVRVAAWTLCSALALLALIVSSSEPLDVRAHQMAFLALSLPVLLLLVQALRSCGPGVYARWMPPQSPRWMDRLASQIWGPLTLENLVYGAYLGLLVAFIWRYERKLPGPVITRDTLLVVVLQGYVSAVLLTLAGAYGAVQRLGPLHLVGAWALQLGGLLLAGPVAYIAPGLAAAATLVEFRLLGAKGDREIPQPGPALGQSSGWVLVVVTVGLLFGALMSVMGIPLPGAMLYASLWVIALALALSSEYPQLTLRPVPRPVAKPAPTPPTEVPGCVACLAIGGALTVLAAILVPNFTPT